MIESEEPLKIKPKAQVLFDEQEAIRLQAQFDEEERIAREKEEANAALIAQWNDIQDKHFAAKRAEERRSKPPSKAQQRSIMTTYLKNMAGWKPKDLKNKSFASVQELFENAMKRVNTFVDMIYEKEGNGIIEIMRADWEVPTNTYCLVNCSKSLTKKTWKIYGSWLKQSIGIQGQKKAMKECYGEI
ncbi:hypothetical protein Tco_1385777 [Tanacetum coccineum]